MSCHALPIHRRVYSAIWLTFSIWIGAASQTCANGPWFDVSAYDREAMKKLDIRTGEILYPFQIWKNHSWTRFRWDDPSTHLLPDNRQKTRKQLSDTSRKVPIILDIEHVPTTMVWGGKELGAESAWSGREYLRKCVLELKKQNPDRRFCLYSTLPEGFGKYVSYKNDQLDKSNRLFSENREGDETKGLADAVDAIVVVGYMRYDTTAEAIVHRIERSIEAARQYGKPVGVIVWPRYHDHHENPELRRQEIESETMLAIFRIVNEKADFGAIWSDAKDEKGRDLRDMPWTKAWNAFRAELRQKKQEAER